LLGNGTLKLKKVDVVIKSGVSPANDEILIDGLDNRIFVTQTLTIQTPLNFNPDARLLIEFDECAQNPAVIFDTKNIVAGNKFLKLPARACLEFRGKGAVIFQDGFEIQLQGTNELEKPELVFSNGTIVRLSGDAGVPQSLAGPSTVKISGTGKIQVTNGAKIQVEGRQHLIIGNQDLMNKNLAADNIDVRVDRGAEISADAILQADTKGAGPAARISFQDATYSFTFTEEGSLNVGTNAVVEFNAFNGAPRPGKITGLSFGDRGFLFLDCLGTLIFGQNTGNTTFEFDNRNGTIEGQGIVQYVGPELPVNTTLAGRIQNFVFRTPTNYTSLGLVRALINLVPSLNFSTFFIDKDCNKKLFNPMSTTTMNRFITLASGDQITNDNPTTGLIYGINNGIDFVISPDGTKE